MGARRGLTTFGVGVTAGAAAYALLTSGAFATGTQGLVGAVGEMFRVPSAAADGLPAFDDCEQLRQWYVDQALPDVGPWGFGGPPVMALDTMRSDAPTTSLVPQAAGVAGAEDAVGSSGTGTNVQESGVDESDVAKTDGRLVVQVRGHDLVVTDVSGSRPQQLSSTRLPGSSVNQAELLLHGDHVLVVGDQSPPTYGGGPIMDDRSGFPTPTRDSRTLLLGLDISDPSHPVVTSRQSVDGGAVSTREYGDGTVRVVLTTGYPPLDFVLPNRDRTEKQATRENRRIVENAPAAAWLPGIRTGSGGRHPLLDCSEVRHPHVGSGYGTISVLTFPADDPTRFSATAVTASGDLAYSSADRLYVATTATTWRRPVPMQEKSSAAAGAPVMRTEVHAFALDGDRTTYVASGTVAGRVKDRWSFSEHDGALRVASALGPDWQADDNAITVLDQVGGRLTQVGQVRGLGPNEEIQSVRWFGDLAVVVTFRQTDPLYTVDLSDPRHPRVVGTLKVPGFSSYLHPIGGDRLVGVGQDASSSGSQIGAQVASFDLRDLRHVTRTDTLSLGVQTGTSVGFDPRTFSYLPDQRVLLTLVQDWRTGSQRFVALHVSADGMLSEAGSWVAHRWSNDVRTLPLGGGRVALVGDVVRVVDVG